MLLPTSRLIAAAEASGNSSMMHLFCCLDSWTTLCSSIIVLATVESLFIPFAMSSIAHCLLVTFWMLLGMVFHARMIDVADFNHKIMAYRIFFYASCIFILFLRYQVLLVAIIHTMTTIHNIPFLVGIPFYNLA
ncbi:hypothetical protein SETIT_5G161700v2 [Setaria italica]|uniref:Uncharacterized protein n=1 Tax=Setaria italica TaxID=4555 RepID=A0A368R5N8_SETIT|nr:hypothetical protein SETIT_5G161700v2 [Setaria italica]